MNKILLENMDAIKELCDQYNVRELYAFGSVSTERFTSQSDIDLLVSFKPMDYGDYADNYFDVVEKLEQVFNRPVDLITDKSLANPYFIESVNKSKVRIYG